MKACGWTIREWPWTRALGERWSAFPPPTPAGEPWHGLKFFPTEQAARAYINEWRNQVLDQPHCIQCGNTKGVLFTVRYCSRGCHQAAVAGGRAWDQKVTS